MNIDRILLILAFICIGILFYFVLKKNNIENFSGDQISTLREEINKQYNMDIEAIRNLGAISKSLLTGKNYHSTNTANPGTLTIPGDVVIEGKLRIAGETELNNNVSVNHGKNLSFTGPDGKKSELFFNNGVNGLEIAQRGCDTLRLFNDRAGYDFKPDHINPFGTSKIQINTNLEVNGNLKTTGNINTNHIQADNTIITNAYVKTPKIEVGDINGYNNKNGDIKDHNFIMRPSGGQIVSMNNGGHGSIVNASRRGDRDNGQNLEWHGRDSGAEHIPAPRIVWGNHLMKHHETGNYYYHNNERNARWFLHY